MADSVSGYQRTLTYDALGRPSEVATTPGAGNGTHYEKATYDEYGRPFQVFDASRRTQTYTDHGVRHVYNARGYLSRVQDAVGLTDGGAFRPRTVYRKVTAMDARGNVTSETLGNGVVRSHLFDGETGRILAIGARRLTDDVQDLSYVWNDLARL